MPRYRFLLEYDGAPFAGWQVQPGQRTVQGVVEDALATVLRVPVRLVGSGRTDTGVHALGQVAHADVPASAEPHRLRHALNGVLAHRTGGAVAVLLAEPAPASFHARYDARQRLYWYRVAAGPCPLERATRWSLGREPDWERMNAAARHLLGTHAFDAFCLAQSATRNRVCTVVHARWVPEARPGAWRFEAAADRFLHGMVRALVGTLLEVGLGKRPPEDVARVRATADRRAAGPAAPAHGLALVHVAYPDGFGDALAPAEALALAPPRESTPAVQPSAGRPEHSTERVRP